MIGRWAVSEKMGPILYLTLREILAGFIVRNETRSKVKCLQRFR